MNSYGGIARTGMEYPQWEILFRRFSRRVTVWIMNKKLQNDIKKTRYVNLAYTHINLQISTDIDLNM